MTENLIYVKHRQDVTVFLFFKYMYEPNVKNKTPFSVTLFRLAKSSVYKNKLF